YNSATCVPRDGRGISIARLLESLSQHCDQRATLLLAQPEHEVLHSGRSGTMAPLPSLGNRRASGKHRLELADDNGDLHECVAEAFTQKHHSDPLPIRISWQPRSLQVRSASMALEHDARSVGQCAAARKIEPRTLTIFRPHRISLPAAGAVAARC